MDAVIYEIPAQVIIYHDGGPEVIDAEASLEEDGSTTIILPINAAPPPGIPIQIILYDNHEGPTVLEGATQGDENGPNRVLGGDFTS